MTVLRVWFGSMLKSVLALMSHGTAEVYRRAGEVVALLVARLSKDDVSAGGAGLRSALSHTAHDVRTSRTARVDISIG